VDILLVKLTELTNQKNVLKLSLPRLVSKSKAWVGKINVAKVIAKTL